MGTTAKLNLGIVTSSHTELINHFRTIRTVIIESMHVISKAYRLKYHIDELNQFILTGKEIVLIKMLTIYIFSRTKTKLGELEKSQAMV